MVNPNDIENFEKGMNDQGSCKNWVRCRKSYDWTVDLNTYKDAFKYPSHFNRIVTSKNTYDFEDSFRFAIQNQGNDEEFLIAAEVVYWKNYGNHLARTNVTRRLIDHFKTKPLWNSFCKTVIGFAKVPTISKLQLLQQACGQAKGFATPITFVAFYDPENFPMVDKHIGYWWNTNIGIRLQGTSTTFSQRNDDGWIQTTTDKQQEQNWVAYCAWTKFCRNSSNILTNLTGSHWRARDVEIAVWESQKRNIMLEIFYDGR